MRFLELVHQYINTTIWAKGEIIFFLTQKRKGIYFPAKGRKTRKHDDIYVTSLWWYFLSMLGHVVFIILVHSSKQHQHRTNYFSLKKCLQNWVAYRRRNPCFLIQNLHNNRKSVKACSERKFDLLAFIIIKENRFEYWLTKTSTVSKRNCLNFRRIFIYQNVTF